MISLKSFFENYSIRKCPHSGIHFTRSSHDSLKKIKAKPYWLAYNLISAFVVSEKFTQTHSMYSTNNISYLT